MEWRDIKTDPPKYGETIVIKFADDNGYGIGYVEYDNLQRIRLYPTGVESTYDGCGEVVFHYIPKSWKPLSCIE